MFTTFNWFPTESAFKTSSCSSDTSQDKNNDMMRARLINRFESLSGNYGCLLNTNLPNHIENTQFIINQLKFYINRLLTVDQPNFALGGRDYDDIKHLKAYQVDIKRDVYFKVTDRVVTKVDQGCTLTVKTNYHDKMAMAIPEKVYGWSYLEGKTVCLVYFVETLDELKDMHEKTIDAAKWRIHDWYGPPTSPMTFPPIILIVQDPKSPLLHKNALKGIEIPILDTWCAPNMPYRQHINLLFENIGISLGEGILEAFLHQLCTIYLRFATLLGFAQDHILKAQTEFFLCAKEAEIAGTLVEEISTHIGNYLFTHNIQHGLYNKPFNREEYEKQQEAKQVAEKAELEAIRAKCAKEDAGASKRNRCSII